MGKQWANNDELLKARVFSQGTLSCCLNRRNSYRIASTF